MFPGCAYGSHGDDVDEGEGGAEGEGGDGSGSTQQQMEAADEVDEEWKTDEEVSEWEDGAQRWMHPLQERRKRLNRRH